MFSNNEYRDCYKEGLHNRGFLIYWGMVMINVDGEELGFYNQMKSFGWEMLT